VRLAYVSPLPPARSGIADYSAELLPALGALAEVTVYPEAGAGSEGEPAGVSALRPLASLPADLAAGRVDRIVYQLGNSAAHHAETYRLLLELPGLLVLHEYLLHHLVRDLALGAGEPERLAAELVYAGGAEGAWAARLAREHGFALDPWRFPLFERVVDRSLGVAVHSASTRRRILESRPAARVATLPMPCRVPVVPAGAAAALRRELGIPDGAPVFATFGLITPHKHLEPALAAFARLRRERPEAVFLVAGEISPYYDLAARLAGEAGGGVRLLGRMELDRFHTLMAATDVAVNLRHPAGGETSATLMRLLALGRAVVVSDAGSFAELPAGTVAKVPVDPAEEEHLFALFRRLVADAGLRAAMGEAARCHVRRRHAPEATARRLVEIVRELPRGLSPSRSSRVRSPLAAGLAAAAVDLGLGDSPELLASLASQVVSLDLDHAPDHVSGLGADAAGGEG